MTQTIVPPLSHDICRRAISTWGNANQMNVVVEECSEMIKAIMKYNRHSKTEQWRLHCVEEAADVSIMLEQLILMLSSDEEFQKVRKYKLNRLKQMLESQMPKQTCEGSKDEDIELL